MAFDWQAFGGQATLLAAVAYLIKTLVSTKLEREADAFKQDLKRNADIEVERLKSSLQIAALEHQVRFSALHTRRLETLPKLIEALAEAVGRVRVYVLSHTADIDYLERAAEAATNFQRLIYVNNMVLPGEVGKLLDDIGNKLIRLLVMTKAFATVPNPGIEVVKIQNKVLDEAAEAFESEIPELQKTLTGKLRALLEGTD